jgi:RNA polymerase sigma-70 factor (ECF subfamily)
MSETLHHRPRVPDENPETDDDLVARAQHDPRAFPALYERYVEAVLRYCYRRLGNWADAEDVTSLVFARVASALPRYKAGSFRSWLFTIAHNAVANSHRGRDPVEPLERAGDLLDAGPTPEEAAFAAEERDELARALRQLPDAQRRVIELRLAGLTGPEIARVLDRSHAAVKMLQLRALDRLQDVLRGEEGHDGTR